MEFFIKIFLKQRTIVYLFAVLMSFFFVCGMFLFPSQDVKALTFQELFESSKKGEVSGEIVNNSVLLTSESNKSLKITATPVSFDGLSWVYQIDWKRVRQSTGSIYFSLKTDATKRVVEIGSAEPSGSVKISFKPSTDYRVEFFSEPDRKGTLLVRKFFTTLVSPVVTDDLQTRVLSQPVVSIQEPALGEVGQQTSSVIQSTLTNFNTKGEQLVRFDTEGNAIDAHDGEIRYYEGKYYLYGTSYNCGFLWLRSNTKFCGFKIYSSTDLTRWKDEGFVFDGSTKLWQDRCVNGCFNLHSFYHPTTKTYIIWVNVQDSTTPYGYRVFTGKTPVGPFTETANPPQLAYQHAGAGNTFLDDDGVGYYAYTLSGDTNGGSIIIEQLNSDFTSGTGKTAIIWDSTKQPADGFKAHEGPGVFKRNGIYYVIHGPACPYCNHTYAEYSSASSPLGKWTFGTNGTNGMINETSCGGQPSHVAVLPNGSTNTYLFMSDLWNQTGFYDWKTDPRFNSNQALANYYWTPLSFSKDGSIQPFDCRPSVTVSINGTPSKALSSSQNPSSGDTGFVRWCDIGGAQRVQTIVPNQSGNLSTVSFTTFLGGNPGNTFPDEDLIIQIVDIDAKGQPNNTLFTTNINRQSMGHAARNVVIKPNIAVVSGKEYGIRLKSYISKGCYGFVYNDSNPYPQGRELYSSNGLVFTVEPNRSLKFDTSITVKQSEAVRLNLGGPSYTDSKGNIWQEATCPSGSSIFPTAGSISDTSDQTLYKTECYSTGSAPYVYTIPNLIAGKAYQVILKFAEISYEKTSQRVFNVDINGSRALSNFDVYAAAGGSYKAVDKSFSVTADSNGTIKITFSPIAGKSSATISAIQVNPQ